MIEKLPEAEKSECLKDFKKQIVERKQKNNQDEKESNSNKEKIEKKENRDDEYIH